MAAPKRRLKTFSCFPGDVAGLINDRTLDYMYGMGIRVLYISGCIFVNMPWQADGEYTDV